jgi:hypothetical protein
LANHQSLASAVLSVEQLLNTAFLEQEPVSAAMPARAFLVGTEDLKEAATSTRVPRTGVTIFPYRVEPNRVGRPGWSAVGSRTGRGHLPLDLYLLVTAWGTSPEDELRVLGRTLQCMESVPVLSGPLLEGSGEWAAGEAVQVVLGETGADEIRQIYESLSVEYRLSVAYLLRVIRIDTPAVPPQEVKTVVTGATPSVTG